MGSNENNNDQKENTIFFTQQDDIMLQASQKAQESFKYFVRELYWENLRIIRAHDIAMIKVPFQQHIGEQPEPIIEHMWINNVFFNGETITGELVNTPHQLTNISVGDTVNKEISEIHDWIISIQGKTYGGFSVQAMRSDMNEVERKNHDHAWGLDFGDCHDILVVYGQKENPENLVEHPMSVNMAEEWRDFFKENPEQITVTNEKGLTLLHREAIAGNKTSIEVLLELGADKTVKTIQGKTALDYAKIMNWEHLIDLLS